MTMRQLTLGSTLVAVAFLACAPPATAAPPASADAVSGSASLNAQTVTLAHGLGVWSAKHKSASVGFFAAPPSAADVKASLAGGIDDAFGVTTQQKGAYVLLKLGFPEGAARADHLSVCEINFYDFADSPLQTMWLGAEGCGATELGGDLRPGGVVHGKLAGACDASTGKKCRWDLTFTTTLQPGQ
jgi:hypothetical protein